LLDWVCAVCLSLEGWTAGPLVFGMLDWWADRGWVGVLVTVGHNRWAGYVLDCGVWTGLPVVHLAKHKSVTRWIGSV
jgi:hypothetical protein